MSTVLRTHAIRANYQNLYQRLKLLIERQVVDGKLVSRHAGDPEIEHLLYEAVQWDAKGKSVECAPRESSIDGVDMWLMYHSERSLVWLATVPWLDNVIPENCAETDISDESILLITRLGD